MGMFSYVCKGCGHELIDGELVRLNGCKGEYDGYGRAGGFEDEGVAVVAWHERCYQKAPDILKADEKPSKPARNQGFGPCHLEFLAGYRPEYPIKYFAEAHFKAAKDVKYESSNFVLTDGGWVDVDAWQKEHDGIAQYPKPKHFADFQSAVDEAKAFIASRMPDKCQTDDRIADGNYYIQVKGVQQGGLGYIRGLVYEFERKEVVRWEKNEPIQTGKFEERVNYMLNVPLCPSLEATPIRQAGLMLEKMEEEIESLRKLAKKIRRALSAAQQEKDSKKS